MILTLDSIDVIKRYFARLSQYNDKGHVYCSVILAQNIAFFDFMDKARASSMNFDGGLIPKACDHERTVEIGWLLYSTHHQDEEWISMMVSKLTKIMVGEKWHPI
jgi:hypothetical protein